MYAVFYLVISLAQFETVVPWQQLIELLPAEIDELDNVTSAGDQPSSLNDNGVEHTESSSQQNAESAAPGSEILSGSLNREFEQRSLLNQPLPAIAPAEVPESNGEQRVIIERVARLQQRIVISWVLIARHSFHYMYLHFFAAIIPFATGCGKSHIPSIFSMTT